MGGEVGGVLPQQQQSFGELNRRRNGHTCACCSDALDRHWHTWSASAAPTSTRDHCRLSSNSCFSRS